MKTYYIYHVPGVKIGATKDWNKRSSYNFETYGIQPIIVETMEGPDNEDFWQIVGDREWELADLYGYQRGEHYKTMCKMANNVNYESCRRSGRGHVESGHLRNISSLGGKATWTNVRKAYIDWECEDCGKKGRLKGNYTMHKERFCKHKKRVSN